MTSMFQFPLHVGSVVELIHARRLRMRWRAHGRKAGVDGFQPGTQHIGLILTVFSEFSQHTECDRKSHVVSCFVYPINVAE